jgi:hypothetical protein
MTDTLTDDTGTTGSLAILNTGAGDILVSFNDHDDAEADRAIAMLEDMQRRGYAIMVRQDDGTYTRAVAINRATKSYVVLPPRTAPVEAGDAPGADTPAPRRRGRPRKGAEQPIKGRRAVAVARSAGGCAPRSPLAMLATARQGASY